MITVLNFCMGNVGSITNMIKKIGHKVLIASTFKDLEEAEKLILPGVGAFDTAVKKLKSTGLWDAVVQKVVEDKVPILGICLGMQLMTEGSEEGELEGFGFVKGYTRRFRFEGNGLKVPHMGWNTVSIKKKSKLFQGMENQENRFYFVHSYAVECYDERDILTTTCYGYEFVSSFEKDNIIGCQFHPEKSHKFGMQLLKNFAEHY